MPGYSHRNPDKRRLGLTLVEMLTVLFVVSILVAFVTGIARHATRSAETRRARADLHLLADALDRYYLRFGDYPATEDDLADSLLEHSRPLPGRSDNYYVFSNSLPRTFTAADPWGTSYRYLRQGAEADGPATFMLYSLGPDKEESDDNVTL